MIYETYRMIIPIAGDRSAFATVEVEVWCQLLFTAMWPLSMSWLVRSHLQPTRVLALIPLAESARRRSKLFTFAHHPFDRFTVTYAAPRILSFAQLCNLRALITRFLFLLRIEESNTSRLNLEAITHWTSDYLHSRA